MWLWKRDDSSPASFEKALSRLSEQITKSNIRLDTLRTRSRRVKALWTLYTSIAYLIYTLILTLVLGAKNWNIAHYGGLLGAPLIIFGVRKAAALFYDWRISKEQVYVEDLQKQRDSTIERLKSATKYNSTQQLLDKYGGSTPKSTPSGKGQPDSSQKKRPTPTSRSKQQQQQPPIGRTGIAPPPTANIPNRSTPPTNLPSTPIRPPTASGSQSPQDIPYQPEEPGFAPNAFGQPPPTSQSNYATTHWYDRLLDLLLGEDETQPKNRVVLLCSQCRLVNGQAPPGVKSLEEIGKWRCGGCGAWNGEESEAKKILEAVKAKKEKDRGEGWEVVSKGDEAEQTESHDNLSSDPRPSNRKVNERKSVIPSSDGEEDDDEVDMDTPADDDDDAAEEEVKEPPSPEPEPSIRKRTTRSKTAKAKTKGKGRGSSEDHQDD